ncbi:fungal-specific transcription factor domain-containing protein [Halenospora varia]|nr:fungal-specific transcription factor domain-containing protein [Halenospora varia]
MFTVSWAHAVNPICRSSGVRGTTGYRPAFHATLERLGAMRAFGVYLAVGVLQTLEVASVSTVRVVRKGEPHSEICTEGSIIHKIQQEKETRTIRAKYTRYCELPPNEQPSYGAQPSTNTSTQSHTPTPDLDGYSIPYESTNTSRATPLSVRESAQTSIAEEDVQKQICQELASGKGHAPSKSKPAPSQEILEYQNKMTATSILGELLGQQKPRRLVQVIIATPESARAGLSPGEAFQRRREVELSGLDKADQGFLYAKEVFDFPPRAVCEEFLQLYFTSVYPYAPCLDRREFLYEFEAGQHSTFLFQAMLSNVVPYASADLVRRAGFSDHATAQKTFFKRATILNDFGVEKRQLASLQGSLLLGTQWVSFAGDKDYRFWLLNAIRIATRMGLHREHIGEDLDPATHKLFRRIWWIIYMRDVVCVVSGLENVRRISVEDCDTKPLTEEDWGDENGRVLQRYEHLLPTISRVQKLHLIEMCKLAIIGDDFHHTCRSLMQKTPAEDAVRRLVEAFPRWRESLPGDFRIEGVQWTSDSVWILIVMSWCYRLECMVYRSLEKHYEKAGNNAREWVVQRLHSTMFELDTIVRRATMHQLAHLLPMSFSISVATVLALHVGIAVDTSLPKSQRLMSEASIRSGIAYLREAQETWLSLRWTLRLFDWVFKKLGLNFYGEHDYPTSVVPVAKPTLPARSTGGLVESSFEADPFLMNPMLATGMWDLNQSFLGDDLTLDIESWASGKVGWDV